MTQLTHAWTSWSWILISRSSATAALKHLLVRDTRLCIVWPRAWRHTAVTRDTWHSPASHLNIFLLYPVASPGLAAGGWPLAAPSAGVTMHRGSVSCAVQANHHHYVNYARKVSLSATFSRYGLYQDFTPYTLNIQDSEHCPGGTLPHASPPHALAQAVKSKAKNFNWPFPLFPTPHCLLVLTAPSLARIQSRAGNETLWSCTVPRETLACKDHNRQVVWLAKTKDP